MAKPHKTLSKTESAIQLGNILKYGELDRKNRFNRIILHAFTYRWKIRRKWNESDKFIEKTKGQLFKKLYIANFKITKSFEKHVIRHDYNQIYLVYQNRY